jgi:hypothetical protein
MTAVTSWRSDWSTRDDRGALQTMALPFIWMACRTSGGSDVRGQGDVADSP